MNSRNRRKFLIAAAVAGGVALVAVIFMHGVAGSQKDPAPVEVLAADARSNNTLSYGANAPQLDYLQIREVQTFPGPLTDAFNAKLSYDDNHTARVFSPISGRVVRIITEMGRRVRPGDPLLVLDAPDYAQAVADDAKAEADLKLKRSTFERDQQLLKIQGIARKDVETAEAELLQANAEAARSRARLRNLTAGRLNGKGQYVLRAPIAGVVSERLVSAGSEVRPDAATPLFVITDPKRLWLQIDLPENQLDKVRVGQQVSIEVDSYPGEVFPGKVAVIGESLDPVTRRVSVRCEVIDQERRLRPEMFARATPVADESVRLPRVPNTALVTQGLYSYVFVEKSPGVLQRRRVTLGIQGADYSYISDGLRAGERVVTSGALLLNSDLSDTE